MCLGAAWFMEPSWKGGFELWHEHAVGAEGRWCCLFMTPDLPSTKSRTTAEQAMVAAETKNKTRRRHLPPASTEPWQDLPKVLGRALSVQRKLKQELLAQ